MQNINPRYLAILLLNTLISAAAMAATDTQLTIQAAGLNKWIEFTKDNKNLPYLIIDKRVAHMWIYDRKGVPITSSAVLLGSAIGDETVEGIGTRPLSQIAPNERTTPAGRFFLESGKNISGEEVLWVDYTAAVSLHRVRPGQPSERRIERLASKSVYDNRISYGCINVPIAIFNLYIQPIFKPAGGYAYILPEIREIRRYFPNIHSLATQRVAEKPSFPTSDVRSMLLNIQTPFFSEKRGLKY